MATAEEKARILELEDVKAVMATTSGRRFMWRLIVRAGVYVCSYGVEQSSEHTAFREGGRNSGLRLMAELQEASPALFAEMMQENRNE